MGKGVDFFNTYFNIPKMIEGKREWKRQMARIRALPKDYQFVFGKIQEYMWCFAGGSGYDMMELHYGLIGLFESGAAEGKRVLDITGSDVAGFCEELLKNVKTYTADWREKLNREIAEKIGK